MDGNQRFLCMLYYRLGAYHERIIPELDDEEHNDIMSKIDELERLIGLIEDDKENWTI